MKQRGSGAYPTQKFMPICKYRGLFRRISPAPHVPPVPPIRIHGEALCGRRKARLAEHFEVQSNVRILYTRYFVPVRCTENENFLKNLKKSAQRPCLDRFRGEFCGYSARAVPTGAPALPETVRRALLLHVSAGSVGFADARRPRHDRADAAFARRRALPPLRIRQPSADCGFYLAIIRKRTTHTGASFVVLRCSSAAVAHSDCPLAARLLHRFRHCRRFARPPQGEDTPFPKEKSGPEIFPSRFSYSVYRFRQIPNPGR